MLDRHARIAANARWLISTDRRMPSILPAGNEGK